MFKLLLTHDVFSFSNRFLLLLDDSERVTIAQSLVSRNTPSGSTITFRNIQSGYVILGVLGPNSRQLLQSLTQTSLDKSQFQVNTAKVKCTRELIIYICYSPAGRSVSGKTVPYVSSTARGRAGRTRDRGHSFSQYGPTKAGE